MKHLSTEERWRRLLAEQEGSGLSVRQFAEERGLSAWSMYGWRQRLGLSRRRSGPRQQHRSKASGAGEIVPVQLVDATEAPSCAPASGFYVELRDGARIHVPPGFQSAELARLLAVLRSSF
jgi:hypothetical protein